MVLLRCKNKSLGVTKLAVKIVRGLRPGAAKNLPIATSTLGRYISAKIVVGPASYGRHMQSTPIGSIAA